MTYYILENDMDIEVYTEKDEAVESAKYLWDRMTDREKKSAAYFQVYEIEVENIDDVEDDFADHMTQKILDFKNSEE